MLGDPSDTPRSSISRRRLLTAGALGAAGAGLGVFGREASTARGQAAAPGAIINPSTPSARSIILFVTDGMSAGTLGLMDQYSRVVLGHGSHWMALAHQRGARRALMTTFSADSAVTDSAAASSAWSTGIKHRNGSLCIAPDGSEPTPFMLRAKAAGKAVGCVTTTTITHATPAGFYANAPDRSDQRDVGQQLVTRPIDLALGGGRSHIPAVPSDARLTRINTRAELLAWANRPAAERALSFGAADGQRLLGTFNDAHMSMVLDRRDTEPSLLEMTRVALDALEAAPNGFFLQIEAGRVDHAGHANDPGGILADMLEADTVVQWLGQYAEAHPDTLVVITTDHGTGGPANTFYSRHGIECLKKLSRVTRSTEATLTRYNDLPDIGKKTPEQQAAELVRLINQGTGQELGTDARRTLARKLASEQVDPSIRRNELTSVIGSILGNAFGIQWVSPDHTGEPVELLAIGPRAATLPAGLDNTDLGPWLAYSMDVPWQA
jgi:alkaline phosphatase